MIGWIRLHRTVLENPIWTQTNQTQKAIFVALLLMANHKENRWIWQGEVFNVQAGQFITSLQNISRMAGKGVTIQNVRTALKLFEKLKFLTNISTKNGRLITITNWSFYQSPTNNQQIKQQTGNKELTPNNNVKNEKEDLSSLYELRG